MIHTALRHDKIVENHDPDFALVEIEAQKIANEAIRALKESRRYCKPAESGIPNLTGVKFGGRLKIPTAATKDTGSGGGAAMSSKSLLDRIRLRNQGIQIDANTSASDSPKEDDSSLRESNPIDRSVKIAKMIQKYLTNKSERFNRATTEQIVDHFRDKLQDKDSAKFKAVLKQVCDFDKSAREWSLKDEYLS